MLLLNSKLLKELSSSKIRSAYGSNSIINNSNSSTFLLNILSTCSNSILNLGQVLCMVECLVDLDQ